MPEMTCSLSLLLANQILFALFVASQSTDLRNIVVYLWNHRFRGAKLQILLSNQKYVTPTLPNLKSVTSTCRRQAPIVRRPDNAIHLINRYEGGKF